MALAVGDIFRIEVEGQMDGQAVNNVLHYYLAVNGSAAQADLLNEFRDMWQAGVLIRCVDEYIVNSYTMKKIAGVILDQVDPATGTATADVTKWRNLFRFSDAIVVAGDPVDDIGKDVTNPALPSYSAVTMRKACDQWELPDLVTPSPLEKAPRGGLRIAGIAETDTQASGNLLTAGALTAWQTTADDLVQYDAGSSRMIMCVVSTVKDRIARYHVAAGGPPVIYAGDYVVAQVLSMTVSPYISSQVSRKQSVGNLG